jgi:integrase
MLALKRFHEARRFGCAQLGWQATRDSTAAADVRLVSEFSDWTAANFSGLPINPIVEKDLNQLSSTERIALDKRAAAKKRWDFFSHLTSATKAGQGTLLSRQFSPPARRKKSADTKHFPLAKVDALIENTPNIRDKLYFLLLFYGGVRISEPLHLFTRDISIQPDGVARVILAHPQEGAMRWIDAANRQRRGTRIDYLADRYGLGPRNLLPEDHPRHAGWKGILIEDTSRSESEVHWLDESKGRLFARYHSEYVQKFRSHVEDQSPYYFCNFHKSALAQPLTISNITKSFYRACARVGLRPWDEGVHPHGARHFYGYYCASVMRLSIEVTQRLMHHETISSTEIYYSVSKDVVRGELKKGQERAKQASKN